MGETVLCGADQNSCVSKVAKLNSFNVDGLSYKDHIFQFTDLIFGHEVLIDGLIGYEFLSEYKTAIDYQKQKIYVWNNK